MSKSTKHTTLVLGGTVFTLLAGATLAAPPSSSPYYTDPQSNRVSDASGEGLQMLNGITCIMSAVRADALVNEDPYGALIDLFKCGMEKDENTPPVSAVVKSTRASNEAPMKVSSWLTLPEGDGWDNVWMSATASAAPSSTLPYGEFRVDYCAPSDTGCVGQGYLEANAEGISLFETSTAESQPSSLAMRLTSVGDTTGSGQMRMEEGGHEMTVDFAYNATHFRRALGGSDQCFVRDARDAGTHFSAWRYGLYDATTGERVERNSGFPIEYTHSGTTYRGYLSYWGLSLPSAAMATLESGATVNKVDYGSGGSAPTLTPYQLVHADGRLLKHSKHSRTLASIDGIPFEVHTGSGPTELYPDAVPNAAQILHWDNTSGVFKATAYSVCNEQGCRTTALEVAQTVDTAYFASSGGNINGWSQALGGTLNIALPAGTIDAGTVNVVYRSQDVVYPSDMPATLYCLSNCPTAATLGAYFASGSVADSPYLPLSYPISAPTRYTSDTATGLLKDADEGAVVYTDRSALEQRREFESGIRTGVLFADPSVAQCSYDASQYCEWQVYGENAYYTWETGANSWNQLAVLKDAGGAFVEFEAPLQLSFNVPSGAAYGEYAGRSIMLEYTGYGSLGGIPQHCVSPLTNEPVPCGEGGDGGMDVKHVADFVIPFSTETGLVSAGSTQYLVKWLEREIYLAQKPLSACEGLDLPTSVDLPTAADLASPADSSAANYIGAKPTVSTTPRVIHGEVKY